MTKKTYGTPTQPQNSLKGPEKDEKIKNTEKKNLTKLNTSIYKSRLQKKHFESHPINIPKNLKKVQNVLLIAKKDKGKTVSKQKYMTK